MMRVRLIFAVYFLAALAGGLLYRTSYAVDEQKSQLSKVNRDIIAEQENIQVLGAEWTYLTDPKRLESLVQKYLKMETTKPQHVAALRDMPALLDQTDTVAATKTAAVVAPVAVKVAVAKPAVVTTKPVVAPVVAMAAKPLQVPSAKPATLAAARVMPKMHTASATTTPSTVKLLLASFQPTSHTLTRD